MGNRHIKGLRTDTEGQFWSFDAGGLKPATTYQLQLRDASGKVASWSQHGVGCDVCLDVALTAMQMHTSGASVTAIREAIDKRYADATTRTPTPLPKKGADHDH